MFKKGILPTIYLQLAWFSKNQENLKYEYQSVSKGYPAANSFMVYCTFYDFLFPLGGNNLVIKFVLMVGRGMWSIKMQMRANQGESHDNANACIKPFQLHAIKTRFFVSFIKMPILLKACVCYFLSNFYF